MYFQLEVDYCSNEANKNKYTNFQSIASIKHNLKIALKSRLYRALYLQQQLVILCAWTSKYFVAWTCCCLKVYFSSASYVCLRKI